jgi:hypothetical protein
VALDHSLYQQVNTFGFMNLMISVTGVFHALVVAFGMHPMHVSVTEIKFDEKDKELEVVSRIFIDDFEKTLQNKLQQPELDILQPKNGLTTDQMAEKYLIEHVKISLDNKAQLIDYLGHEREGEAFIFYFVVSKVKKWKTIQISNDVIMETHDDQSNLVHVTVKEDVKSLRLTREKSADKLTFESK